MRAITVRQPYAWAIAEGWKPVENRNQNIAGKHRGPVAIHAGLVWDLASTPDLQGFGNSAVMSDLLERLGIDRDNAAGAYFHRAAVVAVVDLVDVHCGWVEGPPCSPWALDYVGRIGQYHLVLKDPIPLDEPVPCKGRLGMWTLPADVEARVLEQIGASS